MCTEYVDIEGKQVPTDTGGAYVGPLQDRLLRKAKVCVGTTQQQHGGNGLTLYYHMMIHYYRSMA